MATADLNNDGKVDFVTANTASGTVSVRMNAGVVNGTLTFAPVMTLSEPLGSNPQAVAIAKISNDRHLLVVANRNGNLRPTGTVGVRIVNADGTFQPETIFHTRVNQPVALSVIDFTDNDTPDIAIANAGTNDVAVLVNNGNNTFQFAPTNTSLPANFGVSDLTGIAINQDNKRDLAVVGRDAGKVILFAGNGNGTFERMKTLDVGNQPSSIIARDLNGDGKYGDFVVTNSADNTVSVGMSPEDDSFDFTILPSQPAVGSGPTNATTGDVDDDGILDLVVTNGGDNSISLLLGRGDGRFRAQTTFSVGPNPTSVALADLNNDGRLDGVVADRGTPNAPNATVSVLLNTTTILRGRVFNDLYDIGNLNGDEPGVAGITVFIDTNLDGLPNFGELTATTNANGRYSFGHLPAATYNVRVYHRDPALATTYTPTNPTSGLFTVNLTANTPPNNFLLRPYLWAGVIGDVLKIYGDDTVHDVGLRLGSAGAEIKVLSFDSQFESIPVEGYDSIAVFLNGGTDVLELIDTSNNLIPAGGLSYDGGAGANTLIGPNENAEWHVTALDEGEVELDDGDVFTFSRVQFLQGGTATDRFFIDNGATTFGLVTSIDGGTSVDGDGPDSLTGPNLLATWTIDGTNQGGLGFAGTDSIIRFSDVRRLIGGSGFDTFHQATTAGSVGSIFGDRGDVAPNPMDRLMGPNGLTSWFVTGINSGSFQFNTVPGDPNSPIVSVSFSRVEDLVGGDRRDDFLISPNGLVKSVNGGVLPPGGTNDRLFGPDQVNSWAITGTNEGDLNVSDPLTGLPKGSIHFYLVPNLVGGSFADEFQFASTPGARVRTVNGGIDAAGNTIEGPDFLTTWKVTPQQDLFTPVFINTAGTLNFGGPDVTFYNVAHLVGGSQMDAFSVEGGLVTSVNGGGGNGTDTLTGTDPNDVWRLTGTNAGFLDLPSGDSVRYLNIPNLVGGPGNDSFRLSGGSVAKVTGGAGVNSLAASNAPTVFTVTGPDSGTVPGVSIFEQIAHLLGGTGTDTFAFATSPGAAGATVLGSLSGLVYGNASDFLDFTRYPPDVTVDLGLGLASQTISGQRVTGINGVSNVLFPPVQSISVTAASPTVAVGQAQQFTATGTFTNGKTLDLTAQVTWASSATAASITPAGLAIGVAQGTTSITASLAGVTSAPVSLTVTALTPLPSDFTTVNQAQASTGAVAFAKDLINNGADPTYSVAHLNDGVRGGSSTWIGATQTSFVGISFGTTPANVAAVAWARDAAGVLTGRSLGTYVLQYTTVPNPGAGTPDASWTTIGAVSYDGSTPGPSLRHVYAFPEVNPTGIRLLVNSASAADLIAIDELELFWPKAATASDGSLVFYGTPGDDVLTVAQAIAADGKTIPGSVSVNLNGELSGPYPTNGLPVTIEGLGGNDVLRVDPSYAGLVTLHGRTMGAMDRLIDHYYQELLGRSADAGGLASWGNWLARGMSMEAFVAAIQASAEYRTRQVNALYQQYLRREADATGLAGFVAFLEAGGPLAQVEADLLGSQEYFDTQGGGTQAGFLAAVYGDVLGRAIDATGQEVWGDALARGASRRNVAFAIVISRETLRHQVQALYQTLLGRAADAGGLENWVNQAQTGAGLGAVFAGIAASKEFASRPWQTQA